MGACCAMTMLVLCWLDGWEAAVCVLQDDHNKCKEWAALGHCTSSDQYYRERMIGDENWTGFCEKTCGACRPLEDTVIDMRRQTGQDVPPEAITGYLLITSHLSHTFESVKCPRHVS
jgi:ShK domain-like